MGETWRKVHDAPDYSVSDQGRVRRDAPGRGAIAGRVMVGGVCGRTYATGNAYIGVCVNGRSRRVAVLVARAFLGPRPSGMQVNHKNGIKDDDRAENLEYVTPAENMRHAYTNGLARAVRGEDNYANKLTRVEVLAIRVATEPQRVTAKRFGVSRALVRRIKSREKWGWL